MTVKPGKIFEINDNWLKVRRIQKSLREKVQKKKWFQGVGVCRIDEKWALRVSHKPGTEPKLPKDCDLEGIEVTTVAQLVKDHPFNKNKAARKKALAKKAKEDRAKAKKEAAKKPRRKTTKKKKTPKKKFPKPRKKVAKKELEPQTEAVDEVLEMPSRFKV